MHCPHFAIAQNKAISNTDLPSYAPDGHRSRGEKDSNELTFSEGIVALEASKLNEC